MAQDGGWTLGTQREAQLVLGPGSLKPREADRSHHWHPLALPAMMIMDTWLKGRWNPSLSTCVFSTRRRSKRSRCWWAERATVLDPSLFYTHRPRSTKSWFRVWTFLLLHKGQDDPHPGRRPPPLYRGHSEGVVGRHTGLLSARVWSTLYAPGPVSRICTHHSLPGLRQEGRSLWVQGMVSVKALGLYRVCMFQICWRSVLLNSDKVEIGLMWGQRGAREKGLDPILSTTRRHWRAPSRAMMWQHSHILKNILLGC